MPSIIKELHLARNFEELRKKAECKALQEGRYDVNRYIGICEKLRAQALQELKGGDQERAYMLFYRFMATFDLVKKEDRSAFSAKFPNSYVETCFRHLEQLQETLIKRYSEKQKNHEERRNQFFNTGSTNNNNNKPLPGTSVKVDTTSSQVNGFSQEMDEEKDDEYPLMTPLQLVESIQRPSKLIKVLIIDIRSSEEFAESSIAANKLKTTGEVNIISIPGDSFGPGLTFSSLSRKVALGLTKDALERRRSMDLVVILDKGTVHFERDCKCVLMAMALFKWDQSPECVRQKPVLLKGGFRDFAITYPTYLTNSAVINNLGLSVEAPTSPKLEQFKKGLYNFDEENNAEEEKKRQQLEVTNNGGSGKSPPATLNGFIGGESIANRIAKLNSNSRSSDFTTFTSSTLRNNTFGPKVPGIAKPIIPDRSAKPKLDLHNNNNNKPRNASDEVVMKDADDHVDQEMSSPAAPTKATDFPTNSTTKPLGVTKPQYVDPSLLRTSLPPKPDHLVSSLGGSTNGHSNGVLKQPTENGTTNRRMDIDDDDEDDFVAGTFDDDLNGHKVPSNVPQTPVHRRNDAARFNLSDDNMSEDEDEQMEDDGGGERPGPMASRSKPISMGRPSNGTASGSNYSSAPGSLTRCQSSPNFAQLDESQKFSFSGSVTPKMVHPIVDRSAKPYTQPYQTLLRKPRDFSLQIDSSCIRIPGLRNLGNTCYMNSILQCLNNTSELAEHLRSGKVHINQHSKFGSNGELTIELMELFKVMLPSSYKHISPKDLKSAVIRHIPDFIEYKQQDAHEFLVRFLDRLHADLNTRSDAKVDDPVLKDPNYYDKLSISVAANRFWTLHQQRNKSIISELFEGLIVSTITCLDCNYSSRALEAFTCLSLPIQEGGRTSIMHSLRMFFRQERITNEVAWQCPTCKQKRDAEKCTYIFKLPKVLVIHLKRFSYQGMWKISTFVDFPIDNLPMESYDQPTRSYSLYGVVNHSGSLEGGHYIAYSRNLERQIGWHKYDDQDVSPVLPSEVITQNAYVLFYKQQSKS